MRGEKNEKSRSRFQSHRMQFCLFVRVQLRLNERRSAAPVHLKYVHLFARHHAPRENHLRFSLSLSLSRGIHERETRDGGCTRAPPPQPPPPPPPEILNGESVESLLLALPASCAFSPFLPPPPHPTPSRHGTTVMTV
jgi:hypothetical protein